MTISREAFVVPDVGVLCPFATILSHCAAPCLPRYDSPYLICRIAYAFTDLTPLLLHTEGENLREEGGRQRLQGIFSVQKNVTKQTVTYRRPRTIPTPLLAWLGKPRLMALAPGLIKFSIPD